MKNLKMDQFNELKVNGELGIDDIKKVIPYGEPFLFIDKVTSLTGNKIIATKYFSGKEDFFKGHFVGFPILPGALTVEAMGQAGTLLVRSSIPNHQEKDVLAYKLKEVKFLSPIFPRSHVKFEVDSIAQDERGAILQGRAFVSEKLAAEAFFVVAIVNKTEFRSRQ